MTLDEMDNTSSSIKITCGNLAKLFTTPVCLNFWKCGRKLGDQYSLFTSYVRRETSIVLIDANVMYFHTRTTF